ncbi:MAG: FtsW/RodA/SpoVE family cell cycle protein, partial [Armatimonadota bacterium]
HVLPIAALIFLERDLGTPLIIFGIWIIMMFASGARVEQLAIVVLVALIGFGLMWGLDVIDDYQTRRIIAFANPGADPLGAGYHLEQAKTAVGSGGIIGRGLFEGTQSKLGFVPEQSTDFIFTVVGEEFGFVGSTVLLALYGILLHRCLLIAQQAKDAFGRLIAVGVAAMFFIHIFVNIGMTLGLMPVKGLPLPFFSYGGSNMLASMAAIGLLQNVHIRRRKITF